MGAQTALRGSCFIPGASGSPQMVLSKLVTWSTPDLLEHSWTGTETGVGRRLGQSFPKTRDTCGPDEHRGLTHGGVSGSGKIGGKKISQDWNVIWK